MVASAGTRAEAARWLLRPPLAGAAPRSNTDTRRRPSRRLTHSQLYLHLVSWKDGLPTLTHSLLLDCPFTPTPWQATSPTRTSKKVTRPLCLQPNMCLNPVLTTSCSPDQVCGHGIGPGSSPCSTLLLTRPNRARRCKMKPSKSVSVTKFPCG